jgi:phage protein D
MASETPTPKIEILFAGSPWDVQLQADFVQVLITDRLDAVDLCSIRFNNPGFRYQDHAALQIATPVEVRLGWGDTSEPVFYGEIVGIEPIFPRQGPPKIDVRAFDRLFRLMRRKRTLTYLNLADSDVAQKIAQDHGLEFEGDTTSVKQPYLMQSGESDWDFLVRRARCSGRVVRVEDKKLTFKDAAFHPDPVCAFSLEADLPALRIVTSVDHLPTAVKVQSWDKQTKKQIVALARLADVPAELDTTESGGELVHKAFGDRETVIDDIPAGSAEEAETLAKSFLRELLSDFATAEFTVPGNAKMRAGAVITLNGLGKRLSGNYAIRSSHHHLTLKGYTTRCELSRNGWTPPPPGEPSPAEKETETLDIEVVVVDSLGQPLPDTPYKIFLSDGKIREGQTDSDGKLFESACPTGPYKIEIDETYLSVLERT